MFETQRTDEWLPEWAHRLRPLLGFLVITPIAIMAGLPDWGPEGPQMYIGFFIFPYAALVYIGYGITANPALFFISFVMAIVQFPLYGLLLSIFQNRCLRWVLTVLHLVLGLFTFGTLISLWLIKL